VSGVESRFGATTGAGDAVRFVRVGTLDEPDRFPPDIHIFTASKQSWIVFPPNILAVAEYYKASELWPKESLEPYCWRGRNHSSPNAPNHQRT